MSALAHRPLDAPAGASAGPGCRCRAGRECRRCGARRMQVMTMRECEGLPAGEIAARTGLTVARVERLIEQERDRRELERLRRDTIDNAVVRGMFEAWCAQDEANCLATLARAAGFDRTHLARLLGYRPTPPQVRNGRRVPGRVREDIDVDHAGRLVRAMGHAPCEVEGL